MKIATLGILLLTLAAPVAFAQEGNETRPDDAAWVEDCPPDMMCAAGADEAPDEPTRGPADGSCENCRGDNETPIQYGPDGCIECSGPAPGGETCMDGQQAGEACDDGVQYLGGEPTAESHSDADAQKTVPALPALGILGAFIAAVVLVSRRS